eukprot:SAG11_NODE_37575_length_256_cov_0.662420_1_plen_64_part_10
MRTTNERCVPRDASVCTMGERHVGDATPVRSVRNLAERSGSAVRLAPSALGRRNGFQCATRRAR